VLAYLIDALVAFVSFLVVAVAGLALYFAVPAVGIATWVVGGLAVMAYGIWNQVIRQGRTGQTIGKSHQGISLVSMANGLPVGGGMALARFVVPTVINWVCGLYIWIDLLWPLWDDQRQRLTDKMLKTTVIKTQKTPLALNPFQ
jgi:uncharacterized RDD family membrane protein YckC